MKKQEIEKSKKILLSILIILVFFLGTFIFNIFFKAKVEKDKILTSTNTVNSFLKNGPGVGIIRVEGAIEMNSQVDLLGLPSGSDMIVKQLDELEKNNNIKAIVVRINSPGGTVAATQEIYDKLWSLRTKGIQLVASLGDLAASGGYYIASACNFIMANHGSLTGSIGVIASSPNLKNLFEKLGIKMNVIKSGEYKDILASHRDLTPNEKKMLQEMIDSTYQKFLADAAQGRQLKIKEIKPYADGRIMNGAMALKYKLIDGLGSLAKSILKAKELANLPLDAPVYDKQQNTWQQFMTSLQGILSKGILNSINFNYNSLYNLEYKYLP